MGAAFFFGCKLQVFLHCGCANSAPPVHGTQHINKQGRGVCMESVLQERAQPPPPNPHIHAHLTTIYCGQEGALPPPIAGGGRLQCAPNATGVRQCFHVHPPTHHGQANLRPLTDDSGRQRRERRPARPPPKLAPRHTPGTHPQKREQGGSRHAPDTCTHGAHPIHTTSHTHDTAGCPPFLPSSSSTTCLVDHLSCPPPPLFPLSIKSPSPWG